MRARLFKTLVHVEGIASSDSRNPSQDQRLENTSIQPKDKRVPTIVFRLADLRCVYVMWPTGTRAIAAWEMLQARSSIERIKLGKQSWGSRQSVITDSSS